MLGSAVAKHSAACSSQTTKNGDVVKAQARSRIGLEMMYSLRKAQRGGSRWPIMYSKASDVHGMNVR